MIQEVTVDTAAGSAEQSAGGVRMNIIPREGGNTFSGSLFLAGTNENLQSNNIDDELRALGLVSTSSVKSNWEVNPAFGGPLVRDRLWFLLRGVHSSVNNYIANSVANANAGDRNSFAFAPDTSYGDRATRCGRTSTRADVADECQEQGEPVHRRARSLQLHRLACPHRSRGLGGFQIPVEAAGDGDLHGADHEQGPLRSGLMPTSRRTGATSRPRDWNSSSSSSASTIRRPASSIAARARTFIASMRFKAELMDDSWRGGRVLCDRGACVQGGLPGSYRGVRSATTTCPWPPTSRTRSTA